MAAERVCTGGRILEERSFDAGVVEYVVGARK
jgi:hypothetical protein